MQTESSKPKFTARNLAEEVFKLTGHRYDPGYLHNIRLGNRAVKSLQPIIDQAVANLESQAA